MNRAASNGEVRVWDPLVRYGHWLLVLSFFVAYFTEDDVLVLHVWAGYVAGTIVVLRVPWGVIGSRHARFADFLYPPRAVLGYVADLAAFRARRYLGHSPAGGVMVVALILAVVAVVVSGLVAYAVDDGRGPLAPLVAAAPAAPGAQAGLLAARADEAGDSEGSARKRDGGRRHSAWRELHEVVATLALLLVLLHVAGVLFTSLAHRENLVRAMITGRKRL